MADSSDNTFGAAPSLVGYLFQCRYALLESLRRLRKNQEYALSLESLDDVVFDTSGEALDILQTKHHLNRIANLTDASSDLWKSLRIWCEGLVKGSIPDGSTFLLITTAIAPESSASSYLKSGDSRNIVKALERLNATAESSTSQANAAAYMAFRSLSANQKTDLLSSIIIIDAAPNITDLDALLKEEIFYAVEQKFLESFLQRLEGWWLRRAISHLAHKDSKAILSEEILSQTTLLREQFKQENLPIDDDIMSAAVDATGYQDRIFVLQLKLIELSHQRIFHAIRNYFRAFEQRSRWVREELLLVGELDRYEDHLIEEWDILFQQMLQEVGDEAPNEAKRLAAQTIYKWVETGTHRPVRPNLTEPCIARGTYQILADNQRVGWHSEFAEQLKKLLQVEEVVV